MADAMQSKNYTVPGQSNGPVPKAPQVTVQADCGGRICERAYAEEISNCSRVCHTPTYCTWVVGWLVSVLLLGSKIIFFPKGTFEDDFPFSQGWDMLVPYRVLLLGETCCFCFFWWSGATKILVLVFVLCCILYPPANTKLYPVSPYKIPWLGTF